MARAPHPTPHTLHPRCGAALALALLTVAGGAQAATPESLFYERTLMRAAGARCGLFAAPVQTALTAGAAQARGAALRSGADAGALKATERRAIGKAAGTPCASPELKLAAARVRDAFAGYASLNRIPLQGWTVDRRSGGWRLVQTTRLGFDRAALGLTASGPAVSASFAGAEAPYAVRLRVRDAARDPHPNLRGAALTERTPARATSRVLLAGGGAVAPEGLAPGASGRLYRLPAAAKAALAALDPREAVVVEFAFQRGVSREAVFEVGDFAAGVAFLEAGAGR